MPQLEPGQTIEDLYRDLVRNLTPAQKWRRLFHFCESCYAITAHQVKLQNPEMTERQLRIAMAKRMYCCDPRTLELIALCENQSENQGENKDDNNERHD
jgi:hypothetical protein